MGNRRKKDSQGKEILGCKSVFSHFKWSTYITTYFALWLYLLFMMITVRNAALQARRHTAAEEYILYSTVAFAYRQQFAKGPKAMPEISKGPVQKGNCWTKSGTNLVIFERFLNMVEYFSLVWSNIDKTHKNAIFTIRLTFLNGRIFGKAR
jgi:hypothetical protein